MAGEIKHSWNGTVLTVTSDSGTSSMDLKGNTGNTGPRGPQGPAGIVIGENGEILVNVATEEYVNEQITRVNTGGSVDLSNYATKKYVDDAVSAVDTGSGGGSGSVDLTGYATEEYVQQKIAEAQLGGDDATVNLSAYYTKSETDAAIKKAVDAIDTEDIDLSAYAKKTDIPTIPTKVSAFINDVEYVNKAYLDERLNSAGGGGDLSNYYTKTEIDNKGYQTADQVTAIVNTKALPAVTSADEGKILMVSGGIWTAVETVNLEGVSF